MKWGAAFQHAWQAANATAQSAARHAAMSPEAAATALSEEIVHCLKLALYASQDIEKAHTLPSQQKEQSATLPELSAVTRALQDVQSGRIPAHMAEAHMRRAAQEASQKLNAKLRQSLKNQGIHAQGGKGIEEKALVTARQRFKAMQEQIMQHFKVIDASIGNMIATSIGSVQARDETRFVNAEQALCVAHALEKIDHLFLEEKAVDSPIAPAPAKS